MLLRQGREQEAQVVPTILTLLSFCRDEVLCHYQRQFVYNTKPLHVNRKLYLHKMLVLSEKKHFTMAYLIFI